ncbi:hypothetical protein LOSG293_011120 [Secundilactobacillus oryzae JCM 18671]|uniref:Uncharacterized protein n=1 Tax=Secundilactobacillus oryzae JCM 18671 TaxID=1291743 RepID=A0A081BG45_9LACO|nr:hypothetical protein [Secundilactobacillus oryzae]GAK47013.1 hypothetical protein LOSG293_011120 [Secundilactobacillus oryzae JCM 18671]
MNKLLKASLIVGGAAIATDLALNPDKVKKVSRNAKDLKEDVHHWMATKESVTQNVSQLEKAVSNVMPVIDDINRDIEKFQFKIQPYLENLESFSLDSDKNVTD